MSSNMHKFTTYYFVERKGEDLLTVGMDGGTQCMRFGRWPEQRVQRQRSTWDEILDEASGILCRIGLTLLQ